ncbi:hypothetical protein CIB48_g7928 [Xylaria polymorpha]|nr:hypothetical protein CIB48_g7928 [Xylaria polymorpha]
MVCCTNSKARDAAEAAIRESGLLAGHKGFGLGGAALPLEHPTPIRRLTPYRVPISSTGGSHYSGMSRSTAVPDIHTAEFNLPCEFVGYSGCDLTFAIDDVDNWIEHTISDHLKENLPKRVVCWFCGDWIFDYKNTKDRRKNFENRMWHIRDHFLDGMTAQDMRPDHHLDMHLQDFGLIPEYGCPVTRRDIDLTRRDESITHQASPSTTANLSFHYVPEPIPAVDNSSPFIIDTLPSSTEYNSDSEPLVFASSIEPLIGRRIIFSSTDMNLDECDSDWQSDNDEQGFDYELEITGRGSTTPEDPSSSSSGSTEETAHNYNADVHQDSRLVFDKQPKSDNVLAPERIQGPVGTDSKALTNPPEMSLRFPIGYLPPEKSFQAPIDYAIIAIPRRHVENMDRSINCSTRFSQLVKDVAEVGHKERKIIAVTHSRIIEGVLIPGKIAHKNCHAQFETLVQVKLTSEVFEGDSGSPVLDKSTGSLYGHIVMGVAGTKMAYIVRAIDVFRDIEARTGKPVNIVGSLIIPMEEPRKHRKHRHKSGKLRK